MEGVDYLAPERNNAQFDVNQMKIVWASSCEAFEVSDRIACLVASDPSKLITEEAFVRIAPAVSGVADRPTAHNLFKSLASDQGGISLNL